ncbi:TPA: hypothetical protein ACF6VH_004030, partial [Escherichia coli]
DRNRSHWSTSKTPSYTKSVSWQHHPTSAANTPALIKKEEKTAAAIIERFIICSLIKFIFGC